MTQAAPDQKQLEQSMTALLQEVIDEYRLDESPSIAPGVTTRSALLGGEAVVTSMSLVSFITDVEMMLSETWGWDLTLVSEQALSRKRSPFRTIESLAEYILELSSEADPPPRGP